MSSSGLENGDSEADDDLDVVSNPAESVSGMASPADDANVSLRISHSPGALSNDDGKHISQLISC